MKILLLTIVLVASATQATEFEISEKVKKIEVTPLSTFTLIFDSNPTTGYDWYLVNKAGIEERNILKANNMNKHGGGRFVRKQLEDKDKNMVGVGGHTLFSFSSQVENGFLWSLIIR